MCFFLSLFYSICVFLVSIVFGLFELSTLPPPLLPSFFLSSPLRHVDLLLLFCSSAHLEILCEPPQADGHSLYSWTSGRVCVCVCARGFGSAVDHIMFLLRYYWLLCIHRRLEQTVVSNARLVVDRAPTASNNRQSATHAGTCAPQCKAITVRAVCADSNIWILFRLCDRRQNIQRIFSSAVLFVHRSSLFGYFLAKCFNLLAFC